METEGSFPLHKRPSHVAILKQLKPVYKFTPYLLLNYQFHVS